ncbi:MAG: hypothetical protein PVF33_05515, partial [Candidatus Latescibacterota bacterium]
MKIRNLIAAFLCVALAAASAHADVKSFFPKMDGWEPEGEPMIYTADDLFEYIDGSADLYLMYEFQELGSLSYFDEQGRGLTVDIYQHADAANAYGIYSQERPSPMNKVEIGAQGYYDFGILNFCQGPYYVKILGYDLGEFDEDMLTVVGKIISANIGGGKELPKAISCLPSDAMVPDSQRFISKNVLGHGFLHSAYVAEYRSDRNSNTRGFIIEGDDAADAARMLESYLGFAKENGAEVMEQNGTYRFEDPAARSMGAITVKSGGSYIWGITT